MSKHNIPCLNLKRCSQQSLDFLKSFQELTLKREFLSTFTIDEHSYDGKEILDDIPEQLNVLFRLIRSHLFQLHQIVLNSTVPLSAEVYSSRKIIVATFSCIIQLLVQLDNERDVDKKPIEDGLMNFVRRLSSALLPFTSLEENVLSKIKYSRLESCPFFQYFHSLMDVYYFMMVLYSMCSKQLESMEKHIEYIITNIFTLFKINIKDYLKPEMCSCMQSFWMVVQLIAEQKEPNEKIFWKVFNKVLQNETPLAVLSFLKQVADAERFNTNLEDQGSFCDRIKPNYELVELKFKELLNVPALCNCDTLSSSLKIVEPLICDLWAKEGKVDILLIIWEFYSKRLNVTNNISSNMSALSVLETVDMITTAPTNCVEDFETFVGIFLNYLQKHPQHWAKLKGRIYSQLGPNKAKDLTEIGVRHVVVLYLALSTIQFNEIEKKIMVFLENLPKGMKYTQQIWNLYAAMVLRYVRDGHSIEKITPPILRMLQEAATDEKHFHLIRDFLSNFHIIVNRSQSMQLHQWDLLGAWLNQYQSVCYFSDLKTSLTVLIATLEKCSDADSWSFWEPFFKEHVYPTMKQLAVTSNAPPVIGKIAGKLILNCSNLVDDAFRFFITESQSPKTSSAFLEMILDSYPDRLILTPEQENFALQCWVNVCFLLPEPQIELTRCVTKLECFPLALKNRLGDSPEPLDAFIEYLGSSSGAANVPSNLHFIKLCDVALGNLDKTFAQYLINPEHEKIVFNIYKHSSLIFLTCGNLIYNRNKPTTILTKLVQVLLLPMDFVIGKKQLHRFALNALKSFWPTFFDAIMNLNRVKDPYLERTLRDLVAKYLPLFPTSESPIVTSLENPNTADVVLEKIAASYLKPPINEPDGNVAKALKIISDVSKSTTSLSLFKVLVDKTLFGLCQVIIFHSQRSTAIGVVKDITNSQLYTHVKPEFKKVLLAVTHKDMAINSINYFQLMICVAKFVPHDVRDVLEDIRKHVVHVEKLRGVGFDHTLRLHLERLEKAVKENSF